MSEECVKYDAEGRTAIAIREEMKKLHDDLQDRFEFLVGNLIAASEQLQAEFPSKIGPALRALHDAGFKASGGRPRGKPVEQG